MSDGGARLVKREAVRAAPSREAPMLCKACGKPVLLTHHMILGGIYSEYCSPECRRKIRRPADPNAQIRDRYAARLSRPVIFGKSRPAR
jgi:hypothetical protein